MNGLSSEMTISASFGVLRSASSIAGSAAAWSASGSSTGVSVPFRGAKVIASAIMAGVSSNDPEPFACRVTGPDTAGAAYFFTTCSTSAVLISGSVTAATASIGPSLFKNPARSLRAVSSWSTSTPATAAVCATFASR